jgi:hypothetical protein
MPCEVVPLRVDFSKMAAISMETAKMMIFLQGFIKLDPGISEKCVGQTFDRRKKERKKEEE